MLRIQILSLFILQLFLNAKCLSRIDPLVDTKVGLIRGLRAYDGDYAMFMGIPYAKVDEDNPFGKATPHPKFTETFDAYDDSAICPQVSQLNNTILGSPDCLHLNVYVPTSATSKSRLPVMVWIHGGAFHRGNFGNFFFSPNFLVKHDVIVITLNYRVGAYGFMCLDIPEVPGNQGLEDQYLALQWIKDNIEAFGGDADEITLFGESAGGHSVDLHLISAREKLYNKVMIQSGSSLASTVLYDPDKSAPLKIAKTLGFETNDIKEAISFLAKCDPILVVASAIELDITFKPCVETHFDGVEPFLPNSWITGKVPKAKNVPVLIGFNEHELATSHYNKDDEHYDNLNILTTHFKRTFNFDVQDIEEIEKYILHFYFGDEEMSKDVQWDIVDFNSDFVYNYPIVRTIQKYLEAGAGNIFYYMFSYVGARNLLKIYDEDKGNFTCCASHADELPYLFDMSFRGELSANDEIIVERMTTMWTNFAKFSDPTPETSELLPVKWLPLTKEKYTYMNIGNELSLGSRPIHSRMALWNLFYKHYEKYQKTFEN